MNRTPAASPGYSVFGKLLLLAVACLLCTGEALLLAQQPPPAGGGQGGGGQEKGKGDAGKKELERLRQEREAKEKPEGNTAADRAEQIRKPGAPRKEIENYRNRTKYRAPEVNRANQEAFNRMSDPSAGLDAKLIDRVALNYIAQFTDPDPKVESTVARLQDTLVRPIVRGMQAQNKEFNRAYKQALVNAAKKVFASKAPPTSVFAKINILIGLRMVEQEDSLVPEVTAIDFIVDDVLAQWKDQDDGTLYTAMTALVNAKRQERFLVKVDQERRAATALLNRIQAGDLQPVLLEEICDTLGALGVPHAGTVPEKAEVATELANVALDENQPLRYVRINAAVALGELKTKGLVISWNTDSQLYVIAKALSDFLEYAETEKNKEQPEISVERLKYTAARFYKAIRNARTESNGAVGEQRADELLKEYEPVVIEIFSDKQFEGKALKKWPEDHKPNRMRLANQAKDFVEKPAKKVDPEAAPKK